MNVLILSFLPSRGCSGTTVKHQRSTLYAPLTTQGGKCENTSSIHQRLQNSKKSGRLEHHNSTSIAVIPHEGKFFKRQKFVIILSQLYFGRPMFLCHCGCQANTRLIQRCPGSVATYCAKFQWCRKPICDHDLDPICGVKARTRSFHMWRISCHGNAQSILRGGPTTDRNELRSMDVGLWCGFLAIWTGH